MVLNNDEDLKRQLLLFMLTGLFIIALGVLSLMGWLFGIVAFERIFSNFATMKLNTSLCFIIAGSCFLLLVKYQSPFLKNLFRVLTVCFGCFALASLSQDIFGWKLGIDQLLVTDQETINRGLSFPGRMSPSTSFCFVLVAISFWGIDSKSISYKKTAQYLLHLVTLISFIAVIGYLLQVPYTLKFSFFSSMAVNTSVGFFVLSVAAASINYDYGITRLFAGKEIGNIVARKLFPRMIVMLMVVDYIRITLERRGYVNTELGIVLTATMFLLIGLYLISDTLMEMNALDKKRALAEGEMQLLNKNLEEMVWQRTLELEQSNDRFIKIFNANPICVAMTSLVTGEYVDVNDAITTLLSYRREELIGHTAAELSIISPEYRAYMQQNIAEKGSIKNENVVLRDKHGALKHCILSAELLETGDEKYLMSFVYDITNIKLSENNLQDAKHKLEVLTDKLTDQNKQLLSFAHIISHNLRSPVSNLNLLVHFYNESETDEDRASLWAKFEAVVTHLNVTLEELLETLRIQEDTSKERENLSFETLFNGIKDILVGQIMETKAIIKADFSKAPTLLYPKVYLESILLNLTSNAIKYSSAERVPEINIETNIVDGQTILTVQDNGMGIDMNRHGRNLFGLRKTFHRHAEARGLGLFITKTQIEAMGGEISAESAVDAGTTFKVIFNKK